MSTRVLVVDDAAVFRRIVTDALTGVPGIEVVGTAANGKLAMSRIAALQPDLITLDIEMPEMNGIEVLEAMKRNGLNTGVLLFSSVTVPGGAMTVRALELGAFDFLTKPEGGTPAENIAKLRADLVPMIRAHERRREIRSMLGRQTKSEPRPDVPQPRRTAATNNRPVGTARQRTGSPLVLIGVSTGGPVALASVLPALPADLNVPVFIVQHMPPLFTQPLAASLDRKSRVRVTEGQDGMIAQPNCAYLAPGGAHMKLVAGAQGELVVKLSDDPPENGCRPAVDTLFRSAALQFPGRSIAVVLTGMGNDGTAGLRMLKRGGCYSIAQDEATCVVYGMPKEAITAGLVDTVAPLEQIASLIVRSVREGTG